jgi:glycogen synthase
VKIAILSWESMHSIAVGGVAAHVSDLAGSLQRKGHEVHIFTRMGMAHHPWYENIHGVHYHRCPFESNPNFIEEINNMCRSFKHFFTETEKHIGAFDVVHAHDWLVAQAMIWIKQDFQRKCVFTIHSTEYGRCGNHLWGGQSEQIRHIEWNGAFHADKVICVSKALKGEAQWIYQIPEDKVDVVYNGVNNWSFDGWVDTRAVKKILEIDPFDPMVLFVGRMAFQKGPDILVESIPKLLRYFPSAKFVFVGDGEMRGHVEHRAHEMGVNHATRFLGHVCGWKLRDLFKASDCVVVPSRNEPFGIVILEAWSSSKPVVATIQGGPSEIISHDVNGYKVEANPESIEWGLGHLFEDFEHARWMGKNGRIATETVFSWDTIADDTTRIYAASI